MICCAMFFCSYTQLTEQTTAVDNSRLVTHGGRPTGRVKVSVKLTPVMKTFEIFSLYRKIMK